MENPKEQGIMNTEDEETRNRILTDIVRECRKQQSLLNGMQHDMLAIGSAAPTDLDIVPLLETVFGKIDQLRRTQRTICTHYEGLTGRRALPPQVTPPTRRF
jgi:hypothetical protein